LKNWKAITGLCLIFVFGMMTGGAVTAAFVQNRTRALVDRGPDAISEMIVRRLNWQLRLDEQQRVQVAQIVQGTRERMKDVRRRVQPQIAQTLNSAEEQIHGVLRPEQQKRFDAILARTHQHRPRVRANQGPAASQPPN